MACKDGTLMEGKESDYSFGVGGVGINYDDREIAFYIYDSQMKVDSIQFQFGKSVDIENIDGPSTTAPPLAFTIGGHCECVQQSKSGEVDIRKLAQFDKEYESDMVYKFINSELQADESDIIADAQVGDAILYFRLLYGTRWHTQHTQSFHKRL